MHATTVAASTNMSESAVTPASAGAPAAVLLRDPLQHRGLSDPLTREAAIRSTAAQGISGSASSLPYLGKIQHSFGRHNVSGIRSHTGGASVAANRAMGSEGYATGNSVAFRSSSPSLHTVAHEAAHVVQQRAGVALKGGVGQAGDVYERNADAVADAVVQGRSAESLLDRFGPARSGGGGVQRKVVQRAGSGPVPSPSPPSSPQGAPPPVAAVGTTADTRLAKVAPVLDFLAPSNGTNGTTKSKVELPLDSWFPQVPWAGTLSFGLDVEAERKEDSLKGAFDLSAGYEVSSRSTLGATANLVGDKAGQLVSGATSAVSYFTPEAYYAKDIVTGVGNTASWGLSSMGWLAGKTADMGVQASGQALSWAGWGLGKASMGLPVVSQAAKATELYGQSLTGEIVAKAVAKLGFGVEATAKDSTAVMQAISYAIYKELCSQVRPIPMVAGYAWGGGGQGGDAETWAASTEQQTFQSGGAEASVLKYGAIELERESSEDDGGTGGKLQVGAKAGHKSEYKFDSNPNANAVQRESAWVGEVEVEGKSGPIKMKFKLGVEKASPLKWEIEGTGNLNMGAFDNTVSRAVEELVSLAVSIRQLGTGVAGWRAKLGDNAVNLLVFRLHRLPDQIAAKRTELATYGKQAGLELARSAFVKIGHKSGSDELTVTFGTTLGGELKTGLGVENETTRSKLISKSIPLPQSPAPSQTPSQSQTP